MTQLPEESQGITNRERVRRRLSARFSTHPNDVFDLAFSTHLNPELNTLRKECERVCPGEAAGMCSAIIAWKVAPALMHLAALRYGYLLPHLYVANLLIFKPLLRMTGLMASDEGQNRKRLLALYLVPTLAYVTYKVIRSIRQNPGPGLEDVTEGQVSTDEENPEKRQKELEQEYIVWLSRKKTMSQQEEREFENLSRKPEEQALVDEYARITRNASTVGFNPKQQGDRIWQYVKSHTAIWIFWMKKLAHMQDASAKAASPLHVAGNPPLHK